MIRAPRPHNCTHHTDLGWNKTVIRPCKPRWTAAESAHASSEQALQSGCLFMEVDGAIVDIHNDGHRVAFNKSLASLGEVVMGRKDEAVGLVHLVQVSN